MERLRVLIPGLTCASCVPNIEQVMRQQEGVIWAIVNFAAGEATIMYDPVSFSKSEFIGAVCQIGYPLVMENQQVRRSPPNPLASTCFTHMRRWVRELIHNVDAHDDRDRAPRTRQAPAPTGSKSSRLSSGRHR